MTLPNISATPTYVFSVVAFSKCPPVCCSATLLSSLSCANRNNFICNLPQTPTCQQEALLRGSNNCRSHGGQKVSEQMAPPLICPSTFWPLFFDNTWNGGGFFPGIHNCSLKNHALLSGRHSKRSIFSIARASEAIAAGSSPHLFHCVGRQYEVEGGHRSVGCGLL